jgi:hypothetical protein
MHPRTLGFLVGLTLCLVGSGVALRSDRSMAPREPRLVIWAWERPERLGFIDPRRIAVAFLGETLLLSGDTVLASPRRQPLFVPTETHLIAVVRIETRRSRPPSLSMEQQDDTVDRLVKAVERTGVHALQIDFDAAVSERAFYQRLLVHLRRRLPSDCRLSITALASWCLDDPWIASIPIDEAVPMLFRMGPEGPAIRRGLAAGQRFSVEKCRSDVGLSMDEPWVRRDAAHYWIFNPQPWSPESVEAAARRIDKGDLE